MNEVKVFAGTQAIVTALQGSAYYMLDYQVTQGIEAGMFRCFIETKGSGSS